MTVRAPTGRAGRLWLIRRLDVAHRAAGLLERKAKILRGEEQRLNLLTDRCRREWLPRAEEASTWLLRAGLLGGQRPLRLGTDETAGRAVLRVGWRTSMGVRYPDEVALELPPAPAGIAAIGSAALTQATGAHRAALGAGVRYAAATAALTRVRAELLATGRRLRGVEDRLIPRLEETLRLTELSLDEIEREEGLRLRWAHPERPTEPDS